MDDNSSGEELVAVKTRKPYTITKQRERWTEEEHNLFIEALKLHGRAWQRIEEYIGTKTAVQIRSHAQKFFTKLEKEALEKGIPPGQTHDIDIPPPRPKRKPVSPYPRKSGTGTLALTEELNGKPLKLMPLLSTNKEVDAMSDAPRKLAALTRSSRQHKGYRLKRFQEMLVVQKFLMGFNMLCLLHFLLQKKSSSNCSKYMEFLPTKEKMVENIETDKPSTPHEVVQELNKNGESVIGEETARVEGNCTKPQINLDLGGGGKTLKLQALASNDTVKGDQTHPMHIACRNDETNIQIEESNGPNPTSVTSQVGVDANAYPSMNPAVSAIPVHNVLPMGSVNHPLPALIHFTCFHDDRDAYRPLSSTFSSLLVSILQQNPAFHAAAILAASFWSSAEMETSHSTPEIRDGEIPKRHMNSTPSMEAIAAATIAAASAWWSSKGGAGFALVPPNANSVLSACTARDPVCGDTVQNPPREIQQCRDENNSEALNAERHRSSKFLALSSSYSDDGLGDCDNSNDPKDTRLSKLKPSEASGFPDSDKVGRKKKRDGSSCGSNTISSSEIETDTMEKKQEKANAEGKEANFSNLPFCETNHRRPRSSGSMNESWKEVSEEGRLAFHALFKREVLPQSFAPLLNEGAAPTTPADVIKKDHLHCDKKEETCISNNDSSIVAAHAKFKTHQTGFKPYKRCSVEAENSAAPMEETGNKRMRLQREASS